MSRMDRAASYELHSVISAESPIDGAGKDENASAEYGPSFSTWARGLFRPHESSGTDSYRAWLPDDSIISPHRPLLQSTSKAQTEPPVDVPSLSRSSSPADDGQSRAHLASEEASMTRSTRPLRSRDQTPSSTTRDVSRESSWPCLHLVLSRPRRLSSRNSSPVIGADKPLLASSAFVSSRRYYVSGDTAKEWPPDSSGMPVVKSVSVDRRRVVARGDCCSGRAAKVTFPSGIARSKQEEDDRVEAGDQGGGS